MITEDAEQESTSKLLITGIIVLAIFVIGQYAAMYIPAYVGTPPKPFSLFNSILWSSLFFIFLWKLLKLKKTYGLVVGVLIGTTSFFGASFMAGFSKSPVAQTNAQFSPETEWVQAEFNEPFMRGLKKNQCMYKTVAFIKECDSDNCLITMAGVSGDCVTYAAGSNEDFCINYDEKFINTYCLSNKLSSRACKFIEVAKNVHCE
jgi:hypothetical protein